MSAGRQGASRWWNATRRVWTISAFAHLCCATEKHAHSSFANGLEEHGFGRVVVELLRECDLICGNAAGDELFAHVVVDREPMAICDCGVERSQKTS